jgi:pimeloyl-ACP methyl ester carboxylesterase
MHGFPVAPGSHLAYYSSHGPIENVTTAPDMALIIIHGANRNADDYFCAASAAVDLQSRFSNILLVAPRFYSSSDEREDASLLFWNDQANGPWRYGADASGPTKTSSFAALDKLVISIWKRFPRLKKIVVAGHSSGGQMVQRWTLLTSTWISDRMHSVVANPSSYAYLIPLRFHRGAWIVPGTDESCPQYDQWEWGLADDGDLEVPYRDRALLNASQVIADFRSRRVVYLAGNLDRCNVSSAGWCDSQGLETSCMDEIQGSNRLERNGRYLASLRRLGIWKGHTRRVVQGVGHDHALVFQSLEGLEALFETDTGGDFAL